MRDDGRIDYVELPANGAVAECKRFYGAAFGWGFTDYGPGYAAFEGAGVDGGLNGEPDGPGGSTAPLVVLYAHDLEAMEAKVRAAGAEIVVPIFAFPGGRRFHFKDPAGNVLAVWTAAEGETA
jgi:predicted enzyme related to lactoylglutathione lyase